MSAVLLLFAFMRSSAYEQEQETAETSKEISTVEIGERILTVPVEVGASL